MLTSGTSRTTVKIHLTFPCRQPAYTTPDLEHPFNISGSTAWIRHARPLTTIEHLHVYHSLNAFNIYMSTDDIHDARPSSPYRQPVQATHDRAHLLSIIMSTAGIRNARPRTSTQPLHVGSRHTRHKDRPHPFNIVLSTAGTHHARSRTSIQYLHSNSGYTTRPTVSIHSQFSVNSQNTPRSSARIHSTSRFRLLAYTTRDRAHSFNISVSTVGTRQADREHLFNIFISIAAIRYA